MAQVPNQQFETPSALIALGANLPTPEGSPPAETIKRAMAALEDAFFAVERSKLYQTPCFPAGAGPDYVNAAMLLKSNANPAEILVKLHELEAVFGRERQERWGMRTLDLDLIAVGDKVLPDAATHNEWRNLSADLQVSATPDRLILPHPRLQDRAFVLVPMADIAPDWVHPVLRLTIRQMCDALPADEIEAVLPLDRPS
jgi:2-amino-4-hydroxy-6-hydroxymethyldihydropteridine diphosphokinase